jgi:hypothetical protein
MSLVSEQYISAQIWICDGCGGHDPKSCSCAAATATSREIQAAKREASRQRMIRSREKAKENNAHVARNTPVENTHKKSLGLNAIGKPYSESYDPNYRVRHRPPSRERLYAPLKPAPPSTFTSQTSALKSAWVNASPEAKRHFLVEHWDEILSARETSVADDECSEHTTDAPLLAL